MTKAATIFNKNGIVFFSKQKLIWFFVFLAYINPGYLDRFSAFGLFTTFVKLSVFLYFLVFGVLRKRFPLKILPWIGYSLLPTITTIINHGDIRSGLIFSFTVLSVALIFFYIDDNNIVNLIGGLAALMELLVTINIATIILVPDGLYLFETEAGWWSKDVWFFGLRNSHSPFLCLACFASVLDCYFSSGTWKKMISIITHIIAITTVILLNSGGGLVAFAVYFLLFAVLCIKKKSRFKKKTIILNTHMIVVVNIMIFIFLSFFASKTNISSIFGVLGDQRVYTLERRMGIWTVVWEHIAEAPFFGVGFMKAEDLTWLSSIAAGAFSSHNCMIDICLKGGFITLIVYFFMLFSSGSGIDKNKYVDYKLKNYLSISWFTIFLLLQSEGSMMSIPLLTIIGITYKLGKVLKPQKIIMKTMLKN